jgi:hypothetical protein
MTFEALLGFDAFTDVFDAFRFVPAILVLAADFLEVAVLVAAL